MDRVGSPSTMAKISGILPGSPRVTSVDLKEAAPVRPGTPGFGRPTGASTTRVEPEPTSMKASDRVQEVMDWKTKDQSRAAVARDISDKFFQRKEIGPAGDESALASPANPGKSQAASPIALQALANPVDSVPAGFERKPFSSKAPMFFSNDAPLLPPAPTMPNVSGLRASDPAMEPVVLSSIPRPHMEPFDEGGPMQPPGAHPKGSFLDVTV